MSLGLPGPVTEMLVGLFRASRHNEFAAVDPALQELLGRPRLTLRDVLATELRPSQQPRT